MRLVRLVAAGLWPQGPTRWLVGVLVAATATVLIMGGLGFRWDPFDLARRGTERAQAAAVLSRSEAAARAAEAAGQAAQIVRLESAVQTLRTLDQVTLQTTQDARYANDARLPLSPDRTDRLLAHDRELCRIAPDLDGCSTAPDPADDRRAPLRPVPASCVTDDG